MGMENISKNRLRYGEFEKIVNTLSSQMYQDFIRKQKTKEYQKTRFKKTGIINTKMLANYKIKEDLFIKRSLQYNGNSYGFILLFDMSGSMQNQYISVNYQIILLAKFFRKLKVPFEVYGFCDGVSRKAVREGESHLLRFLSSNSKMSDFEEHCYYMLSMAQDAAIYSNNLYQLSSTPLTNSLHRMIAPTENFINKHNRDICHFIVLTDGQPSDRLPKKEHNRRLILQHRNRSHFLNLDEIKSQAEHNKVNSDESRLETYGLLGIYKDIFKEKIKFHQFDINEKYTALKTEEYNHKYGYNTLTEIPSSFFANVFGTIHEINSTNYNDKTIYKTADQIRKNISYDYIDIHNLMQELQILCKKTVDILSEIK